MFIPRPTAQLHTLSFGQGPLTLLTVGGWAAGGEIWHPLFGHLANWRCISVDHRGAGSSTHVGPITVSDMADDLLAVMDALNVGSCVLAAESSGAAAALLAMQRAPHRCLGLVLVGAAWQRTEPGESDSFIAALRSNHAGALGAFVDNCLPETRSAELRRWGLQMLSRSSVDDAIELLRTREQIAPATPQGEQLRKLNVPTLLIHGENDRIVPVQSARTLAQTLPNAELHVLPGLGHVPIATAPGQVARLIQEFGTRLSLAGSAKA